MRSCEIEYSKKWVVEHSELFSANMLAFIEQFPDDNWKITLTQTKGFFKLCAYNRGVLEPNNDEVICPNCCEQFRAIPVNVQGMLLSSGYEPPFFIDNTMKGGV